SRDFFNRLLVPWIVGTEAGTRAHLASHLLDFGRHLASGGTPAAIEILRCAVHVETSDAGQRSFFQETTTGSVGTLPLLRTQPTRKAFLELVSAVTTQRPRAALAVLCRALDAILRLELGQANTPSMPAEDDSRYWYRPREGAHALEPRALLAEAVA